MKTSYKILLFCVVSLACIGCDRVTKELAKDHLKDKEPLSYLNDTVRLEYVENTGAFLSLGSDLPQAVSFWVLTMLPLSFLIGLFVYAMKKSSQLNWQILLPLALIFSGGVGNIIDRIFFDRRVTDFMNLGISQLRTGIFNFADVFVTAGVLMIVFLSLTGKDAFPKTHE